MRTNTYWNPRPRFFNRVIGVCIIIALSFVVVSDPPLMFYLTLTVVMVGSMFIDNHQYRNYLRNVKKAIELWSRTYAIQPSLRKYCGEPLLHPVIGQMAEVTKGEMLRVILTGDVPLNEATMALLASTSDEDPVPESAKGNIALMAQYWREWGIERGYHPGGLQFS